MVTHFVGADSTDIDKSVGVGLLSWALLRGAVTTVLVPCRPKITQLLALILAYLPGVGYSFQCARCTKWCWIVVLRNVFLVLWWLCHVAMRLLWDACAMCIGSILVSGDFVYTWHIVAFWAYPILAVLQAWNSKAWKTPLTMFVAWIVMAGWIKLNGDIEEKSKITVFSYKYFRACYFKGNVALGWICHFVGLFLINGLLGAWAALLAFWVLKQFTTFTSWVRIDVLPNDVESHGVNVTTGVSH